MHETVMVIYTVYQRNGTLIDATRHRLDATRVHVGRKVVTGLNRHTTSGTRWPTMHETVMIIYTVYQRNGTLIDATRHRLDATRVHVGRKVVTRLNRHTTSGTRRPPVH
jgi:FKBP-type peptidyl-prolyl cis-trans isomerase 2